MSGLGQGPAIPHKGWHSRGYLPHFDSPELIQAVTFRLADALPAAVVRAWRTQSDTNRRLLMDRYLDAGRGACELGDPRIADQMESALLHRDGQDYRLLAWVIMPNHVHVIVECYIGHPLGTLVRRWKTFVARTANTVLGRTGPLWQPDYHDRYIRDEEHLQRAVHYVHENPVKAGLIERAERWRWSSAWEER